MMLPHLQIKNQEIPPHKRILVTSDIHGHDKDLQMLLKKAAFSDDDILFIVGDIIEKGPESLKTLRSVMELSKKGNCIPLIGNVDAWRLHMIHNLDKHNANDFMDYLLLTREWYGSSFFDEMTAELGFICQSADELLDAQTAVLRSFENELQFLAYLPTVVETQNYIFVHAGLPDNNLKNIANYDLFDFLKLDQFVSKGLCFEKYIVVGHWPVTLYSPHFPNATPLINTAQKIISIDGGCGIKSDGQLNLMMLPSINCDIDEIQFICYDNFPVVTALSAQCASSNSIYITWLDNKINVLQRDNDFCYIQHISTDKRLWVPSDYVYANDTRLQDFTTYALSVEQGDKLFFLHKTSKGYIVKKDGVTGWYYGDIEWS